jgi:hypothetical protein
MLQAHRDVGHPLFASSIRNRNRNFIRRRERSLLEREGPTDFKVSLTWIHAFV